MDLFYMYQRLFFVIVQKNVMPAKQIIINFVIHTKRQ